MRTSPFPRKSRPDTILRDGLQGSRQASSFPLMSVTEILEELPRLKSEERHALFDRLNELEAAEIEETPAMLAAIDEGILSADNERGYSVEAVRAELSSWLTKYT